MLHSALKRLLEDLPDDRYDSRAKYNIMYEMGR